MAFRLKQHPLAQLATTQVAHEPIAHGWLSKRKSHQRNQPSANKQGPEAKAASTRTFIRLWSAWPSIVSQLTSPTRRAVISRSCCVRRAGAHAACLLGFAFVTPPLPTTILMPTLGITCTAPNRASGSASIDGRIWGALAVQEVLRGCGRGTEGASSHIKQSLCLLAPSRPPCYRQGRNNRSSSKDWITHGHRQ